MDYLVSFIGWDKLINSVKNGWIAFPDWRFWQQLEHVKYNGWANGWIVPAALNGESVEVRVTMLYWPQLLSYVGYGLLIVTLVWLGVGAWKEWRNPTRVGRDASPGDGLAGTDGDEDEVGAKQSANSPNAQVGTSPPFPLSDYLLVALLPQIGNCFKMKSKKILLSSPTMSALDGMRCNKRSGRCCGEKLSGTQF